MQPLPVSLFLDYLRRSGLVDEPRLTETLVQVKTELGPEKWSDTETVGSALIAKGLITRWHMRQLLKKRYKGFFLRQYKILSHLGSGGMSTVYLAEHTMMHRQVAIKVLPRKKLEKSVYLDRFIREAQAIASLDHPNIVRAYDIDREEEIHYIVMEYFPGRNLQEIVESDGVLSLETAVDTVRQAALALEYAHQVGVVHRDVKPSNLLANDRGLVKVLDLGLALLNERMFDGKLGEIQEDKILGTADYLAPEQGIDSQQVDARADIYGLGCVLYYCLTGHAPFPEGTVAEKLAAHQHKEPVSIQIERPETPDDLVHLCRKMMSKKREDRQQSAMEVVADTQDWLIRHGFADANTFPSLETLQATPQVLGAVPITSQADRLKKLSQTGHWSIEMELDQENNKIEIDDDAQIRLSDTGSLSASSVMMHPLGGSSIGGPFSDHEDIDEDGLLTSTKSHTLEKDPLLLALNEIGRADELGPDSSKNEPLIVPINPENDSEEKTEEEPSPSAQKSLKIFPWYRLVPFWFWTLFGGVVFIAIFLAGVLAAMLFM